MVNLIAGERIVPELMQDAFTPEAVARRGGVDADRSGARGDGFAPGSAKVRARLGGPGASRRAAEAILRVVTTVRICEDLMRASSVVLNLMLSCRLPLRGDGASATVLMPPISASCRATRVAIARGRVAGVRAQWTEDRGTDRDDRDARGRELSERRPRLDGAFPRARRRARPLPQHRRRRAASSPSISASSCSSARTARACRTSRLQPGRVPHRRAPPTIRDGSSRRRADVAGAGGRARRARRPGAPAVAARRLRAAGSRARRSGAMRRRWLASCARRRAVARDRAARRRSRISSSA